MKIISKGAIPKNMYRVKCNFCSTVYEVGQDEVIATEQLAIVKDGLPTYYYYCPVCHNCNYFDHIHSECCTVSCFVE